MTIVSANLAMMNKTIRRIEAHYDRPLHAVSLLAISKQHGIDAVLEAASLGQTRFGENYVHEAIPKIEALQRYDLEWHFVGKLQSNKLKALVKYFDWIETLSTHKHAEKLNHYRAECDSPMNVCIQVNITKESQKEGVFVEDAFALAMFVKNNCPYLQLRGIMCIGRVNATVDQQKTAFRQMKHLFDTLKKTFPTIDTLSMGMTNDMETAISEGATLVRIGTGIFGNRSIK